MAKKTMVFLLFALFLTACSGTVFASDADSDDPDPWATEAVEYLRSYELIPDELFSQYTFPVRRDEFAAMVISVYNEACQNYAVFDSVANPFSDTVDNKYAVYIKKANITGFITGTSKTLYSPQNTITREDAATILYRMMTVMYPDAAIPSEVKITDKDKISAYAAEAVEYCFGLSVMSGTGGGAFSPKAMLTRQETMVILYNICRRFDVIKNGRESAVTAPASDSGWRVGINDDCLYILVQAYPFLLNNEVVESSSYRLIKLPLDAELQGRGEVILSWDRIDAYAIDSDKIYFCDRPDVYSMDKNGDNIKKIRDLSHFMDGSDIATLHKEGDWLFIGAGSRIIKLRTDGTCPSYLSKGDAGHFSVSGQFLYATGRDPMSDAYSLRIWQISFDGALSRMLYTYERKTGMSYSFALGKDKAYLIMDNYDDIQSNAMFITIDTSGNDAPVQRKIDKSIELMVYGEDVFLTDYSENMLNMSSLSGNPDIHIPMPPEIRYNISMIEGDYILIRLILGSDYTRYYFIYNFKTNVFKDI
ncbi:MAG: S-layer homology domain-containing protein [Clostridiales Family XIII bacterium]|jgi:hypothetical protein|nr:S-layer homology domain-containing protein [Clostridiales Family XIII bacterium]